MSKLIVEMEMPKNCEECPMAHVHKIDGDVTGCDAKHGFTYIFNAERQSKTEKEIFEKRPSWCPILGVLPDEHGPLVDFNDVSKELRKYGYIVKDETTGVRYMEYPIVLEQNPIRIPTIVPAERKDVTYPSWDVMCDAITEAVDDVVVTTVKGLIAITVDEEELRRALEYDRDQYAAGYNDGYADGLAAREEQYAAGCAVCPRHKNCMDAFRPNAVNCAAYGVKQEREEK